MGEILMIENYGYLEISIFDLFVGLIPGMCSALSPASEGGVKNGI
jgi:hypothetical protein